MNSISPSIYKEENKMNKKEFIEFLKTSSPSGFEKEAREWLIKNTSLETFKDINGNIYGTKDNNAVRTIMIEGHIDEIGGQILYIDDNGFITFRENGGLDKSSLISQRVRFLNGIEGIIGKKTVHIEKASERSKVKEIETLWIDCGFKNKKEALKYLDIGEYFTFIPNVTELHNDIICSKGIDDKVGAYIAFKVVEKLNKCNYNVYAVGNVQEEVGGFGARSSAYKIKPDICISLDVEFASDIPDGNKNRIGNIKLGEGLVLKRNTDTNPVLFDYFKEYCKKHKLKHQISAAAWDGGGTNASSIKYQREGIATIDIGIPNRYMHTSNEFISWKDIESGIDMLVKVIKSMPSNIDLKP